MARANYTCFPMESTFLRIRPGRQWMILNKPQVIQDWPDFNNWHSWSKTSLLSKPTRQNLSRTCSLSRHNSIIISLGLKAWRLKSTLTFRMCLGLSRIIMRFWLSRESLWQRYAFKFVSSCWLEKTKRNLESSNKRFGSRISWTCFCLVFARLTRRR